MTLKAIIFDLNGVFLKSEYMSDRVKKDFGIDDQEYIQALHHIMPQVRVPNAPDIFPLWEPYFKKWGISMTEEKYLNYWFSGENIVQELLDYAKQLKQEGKKVFILSNNFKERSTYYREHFPDLFDYLDHAYFSWETGFVKPNPEAWKKILQDHNFQPEECMYFDDSQKNVDAAKSIGLHAELYKNLEETKRKINSII